MSILSRTILVCALGYFIDVFDIQLFGVLRTASLSELGVPSAQLAAVGGNILNAQMIGMVLGAFVWGWIGDRFGRLKAMYGSILFYSAGTFACAFVQDPQIYGVLRLVTGMGLAGETGAAITLVAEMMTPTKRTWGITTVAGIGMLGPVAAILIAWFTPWRSTYMIAGVLGVVILLLRLRLGESEMFKSLEGKDASRGSLKLFCRKEQLKVVGLCLLLGLPTTYFWFILNFFSAELGKAVLSAGEVLNPKSAFLCFYLGTSCGDIGSGLVSQLWQRRRGTLAVFIGGGGVLGLLYLLAGAQLKLTCLTFYAVSFLLGCAGGCWALMCTLFTEHFGTNIRATATIVLTNLVRGLSILLILAFQLLQQSLSITDAAALIGFVSLVSGLFALCCLKETHGTDLDYLELRVPLRAVRVESIKNRGG